MKKTTIVLILILAMFICGCSSEAEEASPEPSVRISTPSPTMAPTPEPTPEPTPRPLLEVELVKKCISDEYFEIPIENGTLETVTYTTKDYTGKEETIEKQICVYLPYGYSESRQYDVLFLMHTMSGSERFWFSEHEYRMEDGSVKNLFIPYLLDNMIEKGRCRPLIVVSLCGYKDESARYERNSARDFEQFIHEFRNDILPYIESNYSVYGIREHVGFMGASFGAYLNYRSVFGPNYDLVGNYALTGGGTIEPAWLISKWESLDCKDLRPDMVYIAEGDMDDRGPVELGVMYLNSCTSYFDESNLEFTLYENTSHEFREWDNTLYNCLQLFFRQEGDIQ